MKAGSASRIRGCLIGGAIGDALGYGVEFWVEDSIFDRFGTKGICTLAQAAQLCGSPHALFSDDTQMTLFTAGGLLQAHAQDREPQVSDIWEAYQEWLLTQDERSRSVDGNRAKLWLTSIPELHHRRAPGTTCLTALSFSDGGDLRMPVNNSKGCGGVMRVAPIGLVWADRPDDAMSFAAKTAALTHGHPLGWLPAALLARIIACICQGREDLEGIIEESLQAVSVAYGGFQESRELCELVRTAMRLAKCADGSVAEGLVHIHRLGEGWVGDEALAIALYACLAHTDNISAALRCAVNHQGDSDSTGALCGNILGAYRGMAAFEATYDLSQLELVDVLERVSEELAAW